MVGLLDVLVGLVSIFNNPKLQLLVKEASSQKIHGGFET